MRQASAAIGGDPASDVLRPAGSPARFAQQRFRRDVSVIRVKMVAGKGSYDDVIRPSGSGRSPILLIQHDGRRASVLQISEQLRVTTETVRRDLDVLERRGVLRRIRGGAELLDSTPFEQALAARHASSSRTSS